MKIKTGVIAIVVVVIVAALGVGIYFLVKQNSTNEETKKGFGPTEQEWGYVTVRESAHMFWWLHYTSADVSNFTERPLLIWLQGGPGSSSTGYGNFAELGPLDENLNERNTSWDKDFNVLFVDNPVGTGYSYVDDSSALTTTNKQIAIDFIELLKGFYEKLPLFKTVPLYIMNESYGGKMTAEIALELYKEIQNGTIESNLKGIGIGDAWISPIDCVMTWAPYLLQVGAIDQRGYENIDSVAQRCKNAVEAEEWILATDLWGLTESAVLRNTYGIDFYNILTKIPGYGESFKNRNRVTKPSIGLRADKSDIIDELMNTVVKEALNVNVTHGAQQGLVFDYLSGDFMKPVVNIVEEILDTTNLTVAVYNGQLDLIVDTPATVKWLDILQWTGTSAWKSASRDGFTVDNIYEGYVQRYGKFAMYWVDRSGHMVPADNPAAMRYILKDLTGV